MDAYRIIIKLDLLPTGISIHLLLLNNVQGDLVKPIFTNLFSIVQLTFRVRILPRFKS